MARSRKHSLGDALQIAAAFVLGLCAAKAAEIIFQVSLAGFGIVPRTMWGLIGVLFSPFLHGNLAHLAANVAPLFVLLTVLFWDQRYQPAWSLALIWIGSGLGTWLIGRSHAGATPMVHIGASSLIYGLVAFLISAGFLLSNWRAVIIAILVLILYGGIFFGLLPHAGPVSWEGHLSGAIAGVWAARRVLR